MENFADVKYILNGFLLVFAGILVMWMAAGFAMLETGLTRSKNSVTVLTKNFLSFVIASIMFYLIGYDLMYSSGNMILGYGFMLSGEMSKEIEYPFMADFFFQVVFVATSASVISGTISERMNMPIYAVVGGTHLVDADQVRIRKTIEIFQEMRIIYLVLIN